MIYCYPNGDGQTHYVGYIEQDRPKIKWTWWGVEEYNLVKKTFEPIFFVDNYICKSPLLYDFPNPSNYDWKYTKSLIQNKTDYYTIITPCSNKNRYNLKYLVQPKYKHIVQNQENNLVIYAETPFEAAVENYFASFIWDNISKTRIEQLCNTNIEIEIISELLENVISKVKDKKVNRIIKPGIGKEETSLGTISRSKIASFCESLKSQIEPKGYFLLEEYIQGICLDICSGYITEA
jgi:hypothetical protein